MPAKVLDRPEGRPYHPPPREGWEEHADLESRREAARREGMEQGLRQGLAQAEEQAERDRAEAARRLAESLRQLDRLRQELIAGLHRETVELALAAAGRLLRTRIDEGDPVVTRVIEECLEQVPRTTVWTLKMHPEDIEVLRREGGEELAQTFELVADPLQQRGGLLVETGEEEIDGRVETALAVLGEELKEAR